MNKLVYRIKSKPWVKAAVFASYFIGLFSQRAKLFIDDKIVDHGVYLDECV